MGVAAGTPVIRVPPARGAGSAAIKRIAAELTDQQVLEEGRTFRVAGGEAPVLLEPLLGERELGGGNDRRHRDLDPLLAWAGTGAHRAFGNAAPLSETSGHPSPLGLHGFLETGSALIGRILHHVPDGRLAPLGLA